MDSKITLSSLAENLTAVDGTPSFQELPLDEKIAISLEEHVRRELAKGKKMRRIKREIFQKTKIKI